MEARSDSPTTKQVPNMEQVTVMLNALQILNSSTALRTLMVGKPKATTRTQEMVVMVPAVQKWTFGSQTHKRQRTLLTLAPSTQNIGVILTAKNAVASPMDAIKAFATKMDAISIPIGWATRHSGDPD
jgi:hypothetical protein